MKINKSYISKIRNYPCFKGEVYFNIDPEVISCEFTKYNGYSEVYLFNFSLKNMIIRIIASIL